MEQCCKSNSWTLANEQKLLKKTWVATSGRKMAIFRTVIFPRLLCSLQAIHILTSLYHEHSALILFPARFEQKRIWTKMLFKQMTPLNIIVQQHQILTVILDTTIGCLSSENSRLVVHLKQRSVRSRGTIRSVQFCRMDVHWVRTKTLSSSFEGN